MKKEILVFGIILFILLIFLNGCISTNQNEERIIGSWIKQESIGEKETVEFNFYTNDTLAAKGNYRYAT